MMKKRLKKFLALMIAAVMLMLTFTVGSSAYWEEEGFFAEDILLSESVYYYVMYDEEDNTYAEVAGYETDDEGNSLLEEKVVIPSEVEYNGKSVTVTSISFLAFADCETITEITLPSTITTINYGAFAGATNLKKVIIPDDCYFNYFGYGVFDGTKVLEYFSEQSPDGEIVLGQNVLFAYLGTETDYTVPDSITIIADLCFFGSGIEKIEIPDTVTVIGEYAFASCFGLKEITVPDSVTAIEAGTFSYCLNLETLNLGDNIEYIGLRALDGTKVKSVYIGENVKDVLGAFAGCNTIEKIIVSSKNEHYFTVGDALYYKYSYEDEFEYFEYDEDCSLEYVIITSDAEEFTVPENVSTIGSYAFYNCKQFKKVNIASNDISIGDYAFSYCTFDEFDFSHVSDIGSNAFEGCENLKFADLSNVYYICDSAFENCTALRDVVFGDCISEIGMAAFRNTALTEVNIGGEDTYIDEGAFQNCPNLKRVNFNDGVGYLGDYLFTNCPSLERVYIAQSVTEISENAFLDCENTVFEVIKYSDGYYFVKDNNLNYEIVGKVSFFKSVVAFFAMIFDAILGWLIFWA